ncbi:MAG: voltage-gated potassium channel [Burkholderiales bacterium]
MPQLRQHLGQHRNHLVYLFRRHIQRRHEAQQIRTRRVEQQADRIHVACGIDDFRSDVLAELESAQQAFTAFAFQTVLRRQLEQLRAHVGAFVFYRLQEARFHQFVHDRNADCRHQRIAVVGAALIAGFEHRDLFACEQCRERYTAADAFAKRHDVRDDIGQLIGKQFAGAAHAGLDFIDDQQYALLLREGTQGLHEFARCRNNAAFALHRLEHDGNRLVADQFLDAVEVVQFRLQEARHLWRVQGVPSRLAAGRHGGNRAAVEGVVEGNDFVPVAAGGVLVLLAPFTRQLDRAFIGLGTAIGEEHAVEHRILCQQGCQMDRRLVIERRRRVDDFLCLCVERILDLWRCMPETVHCPALQVVEIALAGIVRHPHAAAFSKNKRRAVGDMHECIDVVLAEFHFGTPDQGQYKKGKKGPAQKQVVHFGGRSGMQC